MLKTRIRQEQRAQRRERRGISLVEIVVAMTLLAIVIGSLGLLAAKNAARARAMDATSARTFVLLQEANRFSVLPYANIPDFASPVGAPRTDTIISGRYKYLRRATYKQATLSEYRTITVIILPLPDTTKKDSLVFQRARTYARSPLFT